MLPRCLPGSSDIAAAGTHHLITAQPSRLEVRRKAGQAVEVADHKFQQPEQRHTQQHSVTASRLCYPRHTPSPVPWQQACRRAALHEPSTTSPGALEVGAPGVEGAGGQVLQGPVGESVAAGQVQGGEGRAGQAQAVQVGQVAPGGLGQAGAGQVQAGQVGHPRVLRAAQAQGLQQGGSQLHLQHSISCVGQLKAMKQVAGTLNLE